MEYNLRNENKVNEENKDDIRFDLVMSDEAYDELFDLISKYVEDPDDVEKELDRYDDAGFDGMSNMVTANLDRDKDYIAWKKKYGIKEGKITEAKMTPAKVQKAQRELVATIQLLKKNFPMYKAAKESGDEKKLAKHRDIAVKLTKKKKQLELALDKALGGLYQDAELELKEAAPRMKKDPDVEQLMAVLKDVSRIETKMRTRDRSRHSHFKKEFNKFFDALINLKNKLQIKGPTIPEGKLSEALPKFKTPVEAYKWIMNKRSEAMDIETEMMETSKEIQMAYGEMEQEAEAGGGPIADKYGKEIEALENKHKDLRAQFDMVMAEIDEYDQNY